MVIYTPSFSFCWVCYPMSSFKMDLLKHYGVHFSPVHPLAFLRIVHFELTSVAFADAPSVALFRRFYRLRADGDLFAFEIRKDSVFPPCYTFMPTSTYPKEWKNKFIFISPAMLPEPLRSRDPSATIEVEAPPVSAADGPLWKLMCENHTHAFNFSKGILALGGLNPLSLCRPKVILDRASE
ncbi:hypothetical protein HanRHA438_Chr14g0656731 [Helianthus annuus]|uniref:Transposase (putative) gypsy type domain-containing protein n=1 Tax=Helianthus annuus TaxID=4232 RepID=A0A9K3E9M8_HELAN|nr:hypothetical protein HanXRQr2_Chr14g0646081 [Helianthus annuus]KAJ0660073.1 hypothetical protein HanOQP8_Chr14g0533521 [Helianthus annuus]KAJ0853920.1 hypothetical protein HanRHA438_Chr14g0656731 [Helianthus annuus]